MLPDARVLLHSLLPETARRANPSSQFLVEATEEEEPAGRAAARYCIYGAEGAGIGAWLPHVQSTG